jgi:hypothetical protein
MLARRSLQVPILAAGMLIFGGAFAEQPKLTVGLLAGAAALLLVFRAPVANLTMLLFLTAVVPYGLQNRFGIGGGAQAPGLLLSDVLLLGGLGWALLALRFRPLDRRSLVYASSVLLFLGIALFQFVHGLRAGSSRSVAGAELREILGMGAFLIALPLLNDARTRPRLTAALLGVAIGLGAWGMAQWLGHVSFGGASDVGVRAGVRLTSSGTGQLQGGEFGFPVAIVGSFAALMSGAVNSRFARIALLTALVLNTASCLVTFERTFWLDAIFGVAFVVLRAEAGPRFKALLVAPLAVLTALAVLSAIAPAVLATAEQRALSLNQFSSDSSLRYRVVESGLVAQRIRSHPIGGSGLGATIFWGQPWAQVPARTYTFSHDGYLWLAWKIGIPAAILLFVLLARAVFFRAPPRERRLDRALRTGAQGSLAGLLLATVTFSSFSALSITAVIGVLMALSLPWSGGVEPAG